MNNANIINTEKYSDERGLLISFNSFDMSVIKRMYEIIPANTEIIRAWQGHKIEHKWFYCISGKFKVNLIKIDNFENPSEVQIIEEYILDSQEPKILHIPGGYLNGFKSLEENSKLIVFSNTGLNELESDDYRFDKTLWNKW